MAYLNCLEIKNEKFERTEFYYFVCFPNDCRTERLKYKTFDCDIVKNYDTKITQENTEHLEFKKKH